MKKIISFLSVMVVFSGFIVLNSWADEKQEALCPVKDFTAAGCTEAEAILGGDCTAFGTWGATGKCINAQLGKGLTCAAMSCESGKKMWIARVIDNKTGEDKGIMSMGRCHTDKSAAAKACVENCKCIFDGKPACKPRTPTSQELAEANSANYGTGIDTLTAENSFICYCDKTTPSPAEPFEEPEEDEKPCVPVENAKEMEKDDEGNCKVKECNENYQPSANKDSCEPEPKPQKCSYTAHIICPDKAKSVDITFESKDIEWTEENGVYWKATNHFDIKEPKKFIKALLAKAENATLYKQACGDAQQNQEANPGDKATLPETGVNASCDLREVQSQIKVLEEKNAELLTRLNQKAGTPEHAAKIREAQDKLTKFFNTLDKNRSVWKNADGSFNAVRLASDLTAGVVLGTVGGVVSGVLIKKSQVEKGFDALHCTVGGQKIADWGDEFRVGLRR